MDKDAIARYLAAKLGNAANVTVENLTRVYPGMSRETWLTDVAWEEDGRPVKRGFVFRRNLPAGSFCPGPLSFEYEIYRRLQGSAVPVAQVFWYERDPRWLMDGREFYVREKLEGSVSIPHLGDPAYRDMHIAMAREQAEKMALIHTLDWRRHGFAELASQFSQWRVPRDEAECARLDLQVWMDLYHEVAPEPFPEMVYVLEWLKQHVPAHAPRISLVKGNNGMDEEIWNGTKIIGMSDWELCHLGDPTEDWAWAATQGLGQLWDMENIMAHYERVSGISIDRKSLEYYRVLVLFKNLVDILNGSRMFLSGGDLRVQIPAIVGVGHLLMSQIARMSVTNQGQEWFSMAAAETKAS